MAGSDLRPLRVGEILAAGVRVYLRNAGTMLAVSAAIVVPFEIVIFIIDVSGANSPQGVPGGASSIGNAASSHVDQAVAVPGSVISAVIGALAGAACVWVASGSHLGKPVRAGESLRFALGRVGPIIWLAILVDVALIVAFIALVVPGIYLYAAWSVALPVLLIESLGVRKSLGRSRALVKGRWWRVASVILAMSIITIVVSIGFVALAVGVVGRGPTVLSSATVINSAIAIELTLVTPFRSAVATVLYYDLEHRYENADTAAPAQQQAAPKAAGRSPLPPLGPPPGESALERIFRRNRT